MIKLSARDASILALLSEQQTLTRKDIENLVSELSPEARLIAKALDSKEDGSLWYQRAAQAIKKWTDSNRKVYDANKRTNS